jgi:hypothetical protein
MYGTLRRDTHGRRARRSIGPGPGFRPAGDKGETMKTWLVCAALAAALGGAQAASPSSEGALWQNRHATRHVKAYEGTKTCIECHDEEAKDVFRSIHYQWKADASQLSNGAGKTVGKINASNDFCTNPSVSWISILTNDDGQVIGNGCSKCHAGLGLKPSAEMTPVQLENIDCLVCHAANYRREVVKQADGKLAWRPVAAARPEQMLEVARGVGKPGNEVCLRCHVGSGGGLNYKRGDLETAHANPTRAFDVHLGSNMQCIQCHKFEKHQVRGVGTQIAGRDTEAKPACEGCHKGQVHAKPELNRHTARVACTTCHIREFARVDPTDMRRDWSRAEPVPGEGKFEPAITLQSNVKPVYAWWNGRASAALLDEPVAARPNGVVSLYKPEGSIADRGAKIHPFKLHTARLPIDAATKLMIPIQVGAVFKTGNIDAGVKGGAKAWFGRDVERVEWIETERYMGLYHEVQPKAQALGCADCHGGGTRLDWKALGYKGDPAVRKSAKR